MTLYRPSLARIFMAIKEHVDLKPYTYFKIGGEARFLSEVKNIEELKEAVHFANEHNLPFVVLGAASNILIADSGYRGVVIRVLLRGIQRDGTRLVVEAGVPDAVAVRRSLDEKLSGFEWAIGIPGTIGGSVRGNAGCFGGEMKDVVERIRFFDARSGVVEEKDNAFCRFAYRESVFKHSPHLIILSVTLSLHERDPDTSQKLVRKYSSLRSDAQDIGSSSAGCVFKNVPWPDDEKKRARLLWLVPDLAEFSKFPTIPIGFLVDHLGLKGRKIGNISISKKHGNYLINNGGATAEEVIMMIGMIKEYIHRKFDLYPEEEIQYIGFD